MKKKNKRFHLSLGIQTMANLQDLQTATDMPSVSATITYCVNITHRKMFPAYSINARPPVADPLIPKKMICEKLGGTIVGDSCEWFAYDRANKIKQRVSLPALFEDYIRTQYLPNEETARRFNPHLQPPPLTQSEPLCVLE